MRMSPEDCIMMLGAATIAAGVSMVHIPSGIITLGVAAVAYSLLIGRARANDESPQDARTTSSGHNPQGG